MSLQTAFMQSQGIQMIEPTEDEEKNMMYEFNDNQCNKCMITRLNQAQSHNITRFFSLQFLFLVSAAVLLFSFTIRQ